VAGAPAGFLAVNGNPPRVYGLNALYRFGAL
jgi:hypothetical protein